MVVIYRKATIDDFTILQKFIDKYLRKDYFLPSAKLDTIIKRNCVHVVVVDSSIVGFVYVDSGKRLFNLFVHPDHRGEGIGKELIRLSDPASIRCKVNMSSGDSTEYYKKLGYGASGEAINGECEERGRKNKKTKAKSILIMLRGASIPPLSEYL